MVTGDCKQTGRIWVDSAKTPRFEPVFDQFSSTAAWRSSMADSSEPAAAPTISVMVDLDWQQPGRHELAERIARTLAALPCRVHTTENELPADASVDLAISERPTALAEIGLAEPGTAKPGPAGEPSASPVGLIVLGAPAARADAVLPLDFSDRELLLACRLVAEIVRLRRRSLDVERDHHELARLAAADPLTGLANRRTWDREAAERCRRALSAGQAVCLALLDVDRFKAVNGQRGYTTGDEVLAAIGHELVTALRTGDLLARLGGDEFAALLAGSFDAAAAQAIVDRVRGSVGQHVTARLGFELSLSAGCAIACPEAAGGAPSAALAALFAQADAALRAAKRAGRDRTC
jgi:diguanylate cyclase (GGDEF)-like protein